MGVRASRRRTGSAVSAHRVLVGLATLALVVSGLWAMVAPEGFYASVALYPPYNRHFIHDIGAFMLGLGATLRVRACSRRCATGCSRRERHRRQLWHVCMSLHVPDSVPPPHRSRGMAPPLFRQSDEMRAGATVAGSQQNMDFSFAKSRHDNS